VYARSSALQQARIMGSVAVRALLANAGTPLNVGESAVESEENCVTSPVTLAASTGFCASSFDLVEYATAKAQDQQVRTVNSLLNQHDTASVPDHAASDTQRLL
jgi:hypothetical protein